MTTSRMFSLFCIGSALLFLLNACAKAPVYTAVQPMDIVCLGDSITSGWKLTDPKRQSFPAQLQKMTRQKWQVLNAGVPGATTLKKGDIPIWKQEVFSTLLSSSPDAVVLMLGTNDTKDQNWKHINSFTADYTELVQRLKNIPSHPQVLICSLPPILKDYYGGMTGARASQLTARVKAVAAATQSHFIDIAQTLDNKPHLFIDGLHPNAQGAVEIADTILQSIVQRQ